MRALILDDSRAMRTLLSKTIKRMGFEVLEAENGAAGLKSLQQNGPLDLALVDWNMPVMNGFDFLRTLRSDHVYDQMRVMMVTTETEIEQMSKALDAGADEYVMKPFTAEILQDKLRILGLVED